jgi:hypothetical protein
MSNLTSSVWWKAAFFRALRTALVIAVPYAPTVLYDGQYLLLASVAGFGALTSIITSLFGIAETSDTTVSWYWAILERVVKTAAQALLTAFGTATLFSEVNWDTVPALVGSAVLGSLLLAVLKQLPESDAPIATATTLVSTFNYATGTDTVTAAPVAAPIPAPAVNVVSAEPATIEKDLD